MNSTIEKPKIAGVIGDPIIQTKSPLIHNYWLRKYGLNGVYSPFFVAQDNLERWVDAAKSIGLVGFNVTKPHKEPIAALVDDLSEIAMRAGSVNTVVIHPNGDLLGDSTDGEGFIESLRSSGLDDFNGLEVAFLGAGGAARAVLAALAAEGVSKIRIANRTQSRAEQLCADLSAVGRDVLRYGRGRPRRIFSTARR